MTDTPGNTPDIGAILAMIGANVSAQTVNTERLATAAEQIAAALDAIAGLMAAPAAVKGTGVQPEGLDTLPVDFGSSSAPDDDGWIQWTPGRSTTIEDVPPGVNFDDRVDIRMLDANPIANTRAKWCDWRITTERWGITHYRKVKDAAE